MNEIGKNVRYFSSEVKSDNVIFQTAKKKVNKNEKYFCSRLLYEQKTVFRRLLDILGIKFSDKFC